ncbi:MAG: hypothetical protein ACOXZH_07925 [Bacteroidales bacterium]|jgi:hypothetical protein|nr:hypothetical protein [Bacteroidales bacterium]HQB19502.1 hypothetical protein [Bacteroidales bacterium]
MKESFKKNILIVIIFAIIGCTEDIPIKKIEIRKVDFAITSIITVDCNNLENYFKEELETIIIEDKSKIEKIFKIISNLENDTSNYKPDVRAKLLIYYEKDKVDTICMSNVGIILNGQSYYINKELVDFVKNANN